MISKITVKTSELSKLHNALIFTDCQKESAISFGELSKVEVKHKTAEQLFNLGRCIDEMSETKINQAPTQQPPKKEEVGNVKK